MNLRADINWWITRLYAHFIAKQQLSSDSQHLLVACQPKSGSTYLTRIISCLPDFRTASLVPGYGRREQELDASLLASFHSSNYVAHHHVRYSEATGVLLNRFHVKPVVLVRDIFDIVVSLRDHFRRESVESSMGFVFPYMKDWPDAQLEGFIAQMIVPWYFNFYLSWLECENRFMLNYEDLRTDAFAAVMSINDHFSLGYDSVAINRAVELANSSFTRKNQAIAGRGASLDAATKDAIYEMASYYDGVDFSPMGISPNE